MQIGLREDLIDAVDLTRLEGQRLEREQSPGNTREPKSR
jgi:hypothetical protein